LTVVFVGSLALAVVDPCVLVVLRRVVLHPQRELVALHKLGHIADRIVSLRRNECKKYGQMVNKRGGMSEGLESCLNLVLAATVTSAVADLSRTPLPGIKTHLGSGLVSVGIGLAVGHRRRSNLSGEHGDLDLRELVR
jgi:hypothetical protein